MCSVRPSPLPRRPRALAAAGLAIVAIAGVLAAVLAWIPTSVRADHLPASPPVSNVASYCFHDVARTGTVSGDSTAGDWLCLTQYALPQRLNTSTTSPVTTPEAWCAQLIDQTGCTGTLLRPDNPTSMLSSLAYLRMYSDCGASCPSGGTVEAEVEIRRTGSALAGVYITNASSLGWSDSTLQVCVEASAAVFHPAAAQCGPPTRAGAISDSQATQRTHLGDSLIGMLKSLEVEWRLPAGSFVQKNKITAAGRILALEAFEFLPQIIGDYFQAGVVRPQLTPAGTPLATQQVRQNQLDSTPAIATAQANLSQLGTSVLGTEGSTFPGWIVFGLLGLVAGGIMYRLTQDVSLSIVAFFVLGPLAGIYVRAPTFQSLMVIFVVLGFFASFKVAKKLGLI